MHGRPRGLPWSVLLLLALVLGGCSGPATPTPVTLDAGAGGQPARLRPGQQLIVRLPANPTTGYTWQVSTVDPVVLRAEGEPEYAPAPAGLVGTGGVLTFRFTAVAAGQTDLTLVYRRPWEAGVPPLQTVSVPVTVG